jgi:hypothetical protein
VGTSPHRTLLLVACLLAAVSLSAPSAHAVELGISDSDAPTVGEPFWAGLGINRARVVVPYDIATTSGAEGLQRRDNFERYLANAKAAGVSVLVVFAPSQDVRAPGTGDPIAPSADEFAAGFAAFRTSYPDVTTIAPWNEPNNRDTTSYALGSNPQLAADYWLRAKQVCPSACTLLAGDFAGIPGDDAYVDAYQAELAANGAVPDVWAFHAYTDVNRFQVVGASDAPVTRYYLSKLQGPWANARIWIDEVGARYRDASGLIWGDASQRDAAGLLLGLATLDPRIDALYYFNYSNQCGSAGGCAVQDRGLVSPKPLNGDAPGYDVANRRRAAYDVIAARGPAILPVPALPPAVTIDQPAQGAALRTATPAFSGHAATTVNSDPSVTLRLFPGAGETESSAPSQTLTVPVAAGAWSASAARLADGIYTAGAVQAGNPGASGISADVVFTVDTVAPTTIVGGPGAVSGAHTQLLELVASEPGVTYTCAVDGRRSKPCTSPVTLQHLRLGRHTFAVRARDAAGNFQSVPARLRWQVISLARALAPRLAGIGPLLSSGLPVAAACEDRCRVSARLDLKGVGTLARTDARRTRAGAFALRLRPRGLAASALAVRPSATAELTLALHARGAKRSVVIRRSVTLVRSGALRSVAKRGLPVTLACSSACSASGDLWTTRALAQRLRASGRAVRGQAGVPRGERYVSLATRPATLRGAGGADLALRPGRTPRVRLAGLASAGLRVIALAGGPGTDPRALSLPLTLPR